MENLASKLTENELKRVMQAGNSYAVFESSRKKSGLSRIEPLITAVFLYSAISYFPTIIALTIGSDKYQIESSIGEFLDDSLFGKTINNALKPGRKATYLIYDRITQ